MADAGTTQSQRKSASRDPKVFVLLRELSEVHLLLDNVSANPAKTVSEGARVARPKDLDKDWIEKVCQISWPPDGSNDEKAEDAALLIRAKDHLNRLSHPASGATIAFTLLVTQGGKKKGWLRRKIGWDEASPTRNTLAQAAYPDLVAKAAGFRWVMGCICIGLVVALLLTCALSWYVSYGNAALAELTTTREAFGRAQEDVTKAEAPQVTAATTQPAAAPAADQPSGGTGPGANPDAGAYRPYCRRVPYTGPTQQQLCTALKDAEGNWMRVEQRLASWTCWRLRGDCEGEGWHQPGTTDAPSHAAAIANILGSAVLPFLYGLLGAGAAIIRSLSRKIRASLLSPRDLHLSFQQLALGAVVGACIGLFVAAPGSDADGESLLGPVALSASAISFVAGFGVEAVFQALESLITRIFNITAAAPAGNRGDGLPRN